MKKNLLITGTAIVALVLAGCTTKTTPQSSSYPATPVTDNTTQTQLGTMPPAQSPSGSASAIPASSDVKVIDMESFSFGFTPNKIEVNKGDKVRINVKNTGGFHDFTLKEFNVKVQTPANQVTPVEFTADKAGTFEFICGVGTHAQQGQKGTITVK